MKKNKKGFTLLELLATIFILAIIFVVAAIGITEILDNSNKIANETTLASIKNAANLYSYESDASEWKVHEKYSNDYFCVTVGELINKGLLKKDEITESNINVGLNTYIGVSRDKQTKVIKDEEIIIENSTSEVGKICTGTVTDEDVNIPTMGDGQIHTDEMYISFEDATSKVGTGKVNITKRECMYGLSSNDFDTDKEKKGTITGNVCGINGLKQDTIYYIRVCMTTDKNSYICSDTNSYSTKNLVKPEITIDGTVKIKYDDSYIKGTSGHYFKSTVDGISSSSVSKCILNNNVFNCSDSTTSIEKNNWYKTNNNEINISYDGKNKGMITARITDKSNNYTENEKEFVSNKVIFVKGNADKIDGHTKDIERTCIAEENEACIIKAPSFEKIGYTALGWSTKETATTSIWDIGTERTIRENLTFYPISRVNIVYIKYNANGGKIASSTIGDSGEKYYWKLENNIVFRSEVNKNSNYKDDFYKLEYGKSTSDDGIYNYNNPKLISLTKEGFVSVPGEEWICESGCETGKKYSQTKKYLASDFCDSSYGDCTAILKVNWDYAKYIVNYNCNGGGGTVPAEQNKSFDVPLTIQSNTCSKPGYAFEGWNTKADGSGKDYAEKGSYTTNASVTMYAKWKAIPYTVTLSKGKGISSVTGNGTYYYGDTVTIDATVSNGYTWNKWTGATETTTKKYTFIMPASNVSYTANATANTYTVTLNNQSATSEGTTKVYYQYNTTKSINGTTCYYYTDSALTQCLSGGYNIVKPVKTGYTFKGYFTSTNGVGTQYVKETGGFINNIYQTVGNKTLYAYWVDNTAPTCTLSSTKNFKSTSQTVTATISQGGGAALSKYYWGTSENGTPDKSITTTTLSLNANKAGTWYLRIQDVAGNIGTYSVVMRSYTVNNMLDNLTGVQGTYNINNYEQKSTNTYLIPDETTITLSSIYTNPITTSGATEFKGFSVGEASKTASTVSMSNPTITANTIYTMWWNRKSYKVTLEKSTGISSVTGDGTYKYGASVTIKANVLTGYSWSKWTGTTENTTQNYTFTMQAKDVTYKANATAIPYKVTLTKGTGISSVTGDGTYYYGDTVTIKATVSDGYTWSKWSGTSNVTTLSYTFKMPANNVSYIANAIDITPPTVPTYHAFFADGGTDYSQNTWTNKLVHTTLTSTDSGSGVTYMQYREGTNGEWKTFGFSAGVLTKNGTTYTGTEPWNLSTRNQTFYFRACDNGADGTKNTSDDNCSNVSSAFKIMYDLDAPSVPTYSAFYAKDNSVYKSGNKATSAVRTTLSSVDEESGVVEFKYYNPTTTKYVSIDLDVSNGITKNGNTYSGTEEWEYTNNYSIGSDTKDYYFVACDALGNCSGYDDDKLTIHYLNTYSISYNCNGGTGTPPTTQTKLYGESLTVANNTCSRPGYTFSYWTSDSGNKSEGSQINENEDIEFKAFWVKKLYRIYVTQGKGIYDFTINGLYDYGSGGYYYGDSITLKANVSSGYTWGGWSGDINSNSQTYTFTMPASDLYIDVNAIANIYSIELNNYGATTSGTTKAYYQYDTYKSVNGVTCYYYTDEALTKCLSGGYNIEKPTKTGYTFGGYYESSGGIGKQYVDSTGKFINNIYKTTGNKTLYAKWTGNTYTITYYLGNGANTAKSTSIGTTTCTYGSTCKLKTWSELGKTFPASSYGWSFGYWASSNNSTTKSKDDGVSFTYDTVGNMDLYAIGKRTFTFYKGNSYNTTTSSTATQYWNLHSTDTSQLTAITIPASTTINTWTFRGYVVGDNIESVVEYDSSTVNTSVTPAYNKYTSLRSVYQRNLTIEYNANGGTGTVSNQTGTQYYNSGTSSGKVSEVEFTLRENKFTKTNYVFFKWAVGSTSGTQNEASSSYIYGPVVGTTATTQTMYAIWRTYLRVYYYSNYATSAFSGATNTVSSSSNVIVRTYDFINGKTYSNGLHNFSTSGDGTYLARSGYRTLGFWGTTTSGGTLVHEDESFESGQAIASKFGLDISSSSKEIKLYPQWQKVYTLTIDPNGGTWNGSTSSQDFLLVYGEPLTLGTPTRTGYKFDYWDVLCSDADVNEDIFTMGSSNCEVKARWKSGSQSDITAPTLTVTYPSGSYDSPTRSTWDQGTSTTYTVKGTVSDNVSVSAVYITVTNLKNNTTSIYAATISGTNFSKTITFSNLGAFERYKVEVKAIDSSGNSKVITKYLNLEKLYW